MTKPLISVIVTFVGGTEERRLPLQADWTGSRAAIAVLPPVTKATRFFRSKIAIGDTR